MPHIGLLLCGIWCTSGNDFFLCYLFLATFMCSPFTLSGSCVDFWIYGRKDNNEHAIYLLVFSEFIGCRCGYVCVFLLTVDSVVDRLNGRNNNDSY